MGKEDMQEQKQTRKIEQMAEVYWKKYKTQIEALEKTPLGKIRPITSFDIYAVGKQCEMFEEHRDFAEASGSLSDLGTLPNIALDVIAITYGSSPTPLVASVQPIEEETGTVYFKDVKALDTAGNITAGQTIASALAGQTIIPSGYANSQQSEVVGTGDDIVVQFSNTLSFLPVRPNTVVVTTTVGVAGAGGTVTATDDGLGNFIGVGIVGGTINYTTGVITDLEYATAPTDTVDLVAVYQQDLEGAADIRELNYELTSTSITAKPYALKGVLGLLKAFTLQKRFGTSGEEELALDLTNAINNEIFGEVITSMLAGIAASGNPVKQWDAAIPSNVSEWEHRKSLTFAMDAVEGQIVQNAGRGTMSFIIAGRTVATYLKGQSGFTKLYDGNGIYGAHLYGTLDGTPVIRVPLALAQGGMDPVKAIAGFKGISPFEAATAVTPFMPLTVTSMLPLGPNPLANQRAAAIMTGVKTLVPNFLTTLELTNVPA